MKLHEIVWHPAGSSGLGYANIGGDWLMWKIHGTYTIHATGTNPDRRLWTELEPIAAQAVLYELTREVNK